MPFHQSPDRPLITVADAVRLHAARRPDAIALICDDEEISFAQLQQHATQVCAGLRALGAMPGARIAFLGKNCIEYVACLLGAIKAGAVLAPVNWRLAGPEIAQIVADADAPVLVVDASFAGTVRAIAEQLPKVRHILCIGAQSGTDPWPDFGAWRDAQGVNPADQADAPAQPSDVALQIYTSGTTGLPKGAMLSHDNLLAMCGIDNDAWPAWNCWTVDDISLVTPPLFHIGGTGWLVRGLFSGARQIIQRDFSAAGVLALIGRHRVTRVPLVPAALRMVLQDPATRHADLKSVRLVYYGTSPMPEDLLAEAVAVFGCGFTQSYGMTETCATIVALAPDDHTLPATPRMRSAGKALPGVELVILDADGRPVAPGVVGEIVTRSRSNMIGYWKRPQATAEAIDRDGWLHSGDAGWLDADGYVTIHDRVKDMIVSGGENVYPAEVENALFGHPAVADVAVIGVPSGQWGEAVKAIIVLKPGHQADAAELTAWARQRIGGFKVPKSFDFVDALPRNPSGKILKRELRAPWWAGRTREVN